MLVFRYAQPDKLFDILGQQINCAWCDKMLNKGHIPITYGICNKCYKIELKRKLDGIKKNKRVVGYMD